MTATSYVTSTALPSIGCPVAFATSGTPLEPYANFLRGFRNNQIQNTTAGRMFMQTFNAWYYGWAPSLTYAAARNGLVLDLLRVGVYPLIGILYASYYSYLLLSPLNNELAGVTAGLIAAGMIGLVYVAPPLCLVLRALRRKGGGISLLRSPHLATLTATSGMAVGLTYFSGAELALGIATVSLILSTLTLGATLGIRVLSSSDFPHPIRETAALVRAFKSLSWRLVLGPDTRGQKV
jgi:hypothetical protein